MGYSTELFCVLVFIVAAAGTQTEVETSGIVTLEGTSCKKVLLNTQKQLNIKSEDGRMIYVTTS